MTKRNNSQPDNSNAHLEPPQPTQVMAVICPEKIWDSIRIVLRKLPVEDVEVILETMQAMRPQPVTMQMPPGQQPPGQQPTQQ